MSPKLNEPCHLGSYGPKAVERLTWQVCKMAARHCESNRDMAWRKDSRSNHRTMKRLATLVVAIIALSESARAQGTIDFHNPSTFPLRLNDGTTTTIVGAPGSPLGPASVRVG